MHLAVFVKQALICFGCCLLICTKGFGNNEPYNTSAYRFKSITVNDNLSHSDVNCIVQDTFGYIWIGTNNGLNRFDGYRVTTFKYNLEDTLSIPGNRVQKMAIDSTGQIWVGIENKGLFRFHPNEMIFREVVLPFPNLNFIGMRVDSFGDIWVNKRRFGLCRLMLNEKGGVEKIVTYPAKDIKPNDPDFDIRFIHSGARGLYMVLTDNSLWYFDPQKNIFEKKLDSTQWPIAQSEQIQSLWEGKDQLWIGTDDGVWQTALGIRGKGVSHFGERALVKVAMTSSLSVNHMFKDDQGRLWMGTGMGLYVLSELKGEAGSLRLSLVQKIDFSSSAIDSDRITGLYEDRFGVLWVGSTGGINYTNLRNKAFVHVEMEEVQERRDYTASAIYKGKDGKVWMGSRSALYIYDPIRNIGKNYQDGTGPGNLKGNYVTRIFEDRRGDIWLLMKNRGLSKVLNENGDLKFEAWPRRGPNGTQLALNLMYMVEDQAENLWISTFNDGVYILDEERQNYTNLRHDPRNPNSLSSNKLTALYADPLDGSIWVSTRDGGLNHLTKANNGGWNYQHFRYAADDTSSISSDHTWQIYRAKNGQLWVATLAGGLNKVIEKADGSYSFERFTIKDGLVDNDVESLAEDDQGNLWLAGRGLTRFNPTTKNFQHFDYQDGLQSNSFKIGAVHKDRDGILYFGGIKGINYFDPQAIIADDIVPAMYVTGLRVNGRPVMVGEWIKGRQLLTASLFDLPKIELKATENDFTIDFVGIQLASSIKNEYRFTLEGLNGTWVTTRYPNLSATYSNIPPGDYVFKLKASNGDGIWNKETLEWPIHIASPWYRTPLAFVVYGLLGILALFLFRKNTEKQLSLKNELIIAEKEKDLNRSKLSFFTNISHELRSPLTLIKGPLEELLLHPKVRKETKEKLQIMQNSSNRLLNLMNQLLDFRKVETGNMRLQAATGNYVKFCQELYLIFSQSANDKMIQFRFDTPFSDIQLAYDRDKMETVLMNLLSNACKFTPENGSIIIRLSVKGDKQEEAIYDAETGDLLNHYLQLEVRDSGMGMDEKEMDKIFNPYYQVKNTDTLHFTGTGIGLSLVKGVVDLHKGKVEVHSKRKKGTLFLVKLPFGTSHLSDDQLIPNFKNSEYLGHYLENKNNAVTETTISGNQYLKSIDERSKKYTVMIVEDNASLRSYLKQVLEIDFIVNEAVNGKEALEIILDNPPDIVVSDVMMPIMDGIRLCKSIKEHELIAHLPVILLTARTSRVYELEGLDMGAESYITKPFNAELLKSRIYAILKNREHLREYYRKQLFFESVKENQLSPEEKLVHQAIEIVEANLGDTNFNVQRLAELLFQSQSSLYRKIKTVTGKSLVEFVRDIRLRKAAQLIQEGELSITEIAYKVGFSSIKYFRQCFKKLYQVTPSAFGEASRPTRQDTGTKISTP